MPTASGTATPHIPLPWLILLGALIAIGPLSIDMYLPGFPAIEAELAGRGGRAEFTLAGFFIGLALGQLLYGPLSDRFGRKKPLYAGLVLYAIASLACALAGSLEALVAARFFQALGGCAGMVITRAIVRDRCAASEAARVFSLLMLVMGLAPILAPMAGGWVVAGPGWRAIFWLLALFGLASLAAVHFRLEESHDTRHAPPLRLGRVLADYGSLLRHRAFLGHTLSSGLAMAGMFAYIAGSPHVLIGLYGVAPENYGWMFGLNALGFIIASQVNARLLRRYGLSHLLRQALRGLALIGLALAALALAGHPPLPLTLAVLLAFMSCMGFIPPNASAAALASHGQLAGTASALIGSLQFGLATLAGAAVGYWKNDSLAPLGLVMAGCALGAWALHRWLVTGSRRD